MISIGWRNLKRDPTRCAIAVLGVVFAVVLVTVEVGMLLGLVRNASLLIDQSRADLWVSTVDVKTFDFATPIDQRKRYRIEAVPGVERVEEFNVSYSIWKLPGGGNANCQVIAMDDGGQLAAPLNLCAGSVEALHNQDAVIIDEGERAKLGNPNLGETVEVLGHRAKIVGFTRDTRSFTTTPFVFCSLRRGVKYGDLLHDNSGISIYFLVKVKPGFDRESVRAAIAGAIPDIEVHTREGFSWRTRSYWLIEQLRVFHLRSKPERRRYRGSSVAVEKSDLSERPKSKSRTCSPITAFEAPVIWGTSFDLIRTMLFRRGGSRHCRVQATSSSAG